MCIRDSLYTKEITPGSFAPALEVKNEGFQTSGQVQYVAAAGNFREAGYSYTGALRILKVMLSYEYLWTNIRVKGGAYGCMSAFRRNGDGFLVSYRDPNLVKTLEVFQKTGDFIRSFDADERETVSYTHLDVYKRQEYTCLLIRCFQGLPKVVLSFSHHNLPCLEYLLL